MRERRSAAQPALLLRSKNEKKRREEIGYHFGSGDGDGDSGGEGGREGGGEGGRDAFRETTVLGGCPGSSQKDIIQGKRVGLGLRGLARRGNREVRVK